MSIIPTDAMYFFMITAFTKKMEEAAAKGDKKTFDDMQEQIKWLQSSQRNKYKN